MPDTPSITINKVMPYRGQQEVWSNTYHFSGTTPANDAAWHTLALAIWAAEAPMLHSLTKFCGYLGYEAGNEHAVSIKNYIEDGTAQIPGSGPGGTSTAPGDVAFWVRWMTPDRTSRGKRIYLRKYFHGFGNNNDVLATGISAAAMTYAGKMTDGTLPGSARICGPQGAVAGTAKVSTYTTTRTLKRRGKRPSR